MKNKDLLYSVLDMEYDKKIVILENFLDEYKRNTIERYIPFCTFIDNVYRYKNEVSFSFISAIVHYEIRNRILTPKYPGTLSNVYMFDANKKEERIKFIEDVIALYESGIEYFLMGRSFGLLLYSNRKNRINAVKNVINEYKQQDEVMLCLFLRKSGKKLKFEDKDYVNYLIDFETQKVKKNGGDKLFDTDTKEERIKWLRNKKTEIILETFSFFNDPDERIQKVRRQINKVQTPDELLRVLVDNYSIPKISDMLTSWYLLTMFEEEVLKRNNIFTEDTTLHLPMPTRPIVVLGNAKLKVTTKERIKIFTGERSAIEVAVINTNADILTRDNSVAYIVGSKNSSLNIKTEDRSYCNIQLFNKGNIIGMINDNSSVELEMNGHSTGGLVIAGDARCMIKEEGNANTNIKLFNTCDLDIRLNNESKAKIQAYNSSKYTSTLFHESHAMVEGYDYSTCEIKIYNRVSCGVAFFDETKNYVRTESNKILSIGLEGNSMTKINANIDADVRCNVKNDSMLSIVLTDLSQLQITTQDHSVTNIYGTPNTYTNLTAMDLSTVATETTGTITTVKKNENCTIKNKLIRKLN